MNELQTKAFEYLTSGGSERRSALTELLDEGFFGTEDDLQDSVDFLFEYLDDQLERDNYCSGGIQRFRDNVLDGYTRSSDGESESGERTDQVAVAVVLTITHNKGNPNDSANDNAFTDTVAAGIERGIGFLAGDGWKIDGIAEELEWEVR